MPVHVDDAVGHQVGHMDFQGIFTGMKKVPDPDPGGNAPYNTGVVAIHPDFSAFPDISEVEDVSISLGTLET